MKNRLRGFLERSVFVEAVLLLPRQQDILPKPLAADDHRIRRPKREEFQQREAEVLLEIFRVLLNQFADLFVPAMTGLRVRVPTPPDPFVAVGGSDITFTCRRVSDEIHPLHMG